MPDSEAIKELKQDIVNLAGLMIQMLTKPEKEVETYNALVNIQDKWYQELC